jgi:hypothetical protein
MKKLRNEITYDVACACEKCRKASKRDFEIIGGQLRYSLKAARQELKTYRTDSHSPPFLVRETLEPVHQIPKKESQDAKGGVVYF